MKWLLSLLLFVSAINSNAQNENKSLDIIFKSIEKNIIQEKYSAVLPLYEKAKSIYSNSKEKNIPVWINIQLLSGEAEHKLMHLENANQIWIAAMENAFALEKNNEAKTAFSNLQKLHQEIIDKKLPFKYPNIGATERTIVYYPITKIFEKNDSTFVEISAGKYDRLDESYSSATGFTKYITNKRESQKIISQVIRKEINNNSTIFFTPKSDSSYIIGDLIAVRENTPVKWRENPLTEWMKLNIGLLDEKNDKIFNSRFFKYFSSATAFEILDKKIRDEIKSKIAIWKTDSDAVNFNKTPLSAGIFYDQHFFDVVEKFNQDEMNLFISFVNDFPGKYMGNNYVFSEIFATWIVNNTLLAKSTILPYLRKFNDDELFYKVYNLRDQIKDSTLLDSWRDEGMMQIKAEDFSGALATFFVLSNASNINDQPIQKGWAYFLLGNEYQKIGSPKDALRCIEIADSIFLATNFNEGKKWIEATKEYWRQTEALKIDVQQGHLSEYRIAQSQQAKYIATAGVDGTVKIWDRNFGKTIQTIQENSSPITNIVFSNIGRYFATATEDSVLNIYNSFNYQLLFTFKNNWIIRAMTFTEADENIIIVGDNGNVQKFDFRNNNILMNYVGHSKTVNDIQLKPNEKEYFWTVSSDSTAKKWNINDSIWLESYPHSDAAMSLQISPNSNYISIVQSDSLIQCWNTDLNKRYFSVKVNLPKNVNAKYFAGSFSPDNQFYAFPNNNYISILKLDTIGQVDYQTFLIGYNLQSVQYTKEGNALIAQFDKGLFKIYSMSGWDFTNRPTLTEKTINQYQNKILQVKFNPNSDQVFTTSSSYGIIDLKTGNFSSSDNQILFAPTNHFLLNNANLYAMTSDKENQIGIWNNLKNSVDAVFSVDTAEKVILINVDSSMKYIAAATKEKIYIWNLQDEKLIYTISNGKLFPTQIEISATRNLITLGYDSGLIISYDLKNGDEKFSVNVPSLNHFISDNNFYYATTTKGILYKISNKNKKDVLQVSLNENGKPSYELKIDSSGKKLFVQHWQNGIKVFENENLKMIYEIKDVKSKINSFDISKNGRFFAAGTEDSRVLLFDANFGKLLVKTYLPRHKGMLITNADGYYLSTKNALEAINFTYQQTAFNYEQFDLVRNRPDKILESIGIADSQIVKSYRAAYEKRLKKTGISENQISKNMHIPKVRLPDKNLIGLSSSKPKFDFSIVCTDDSFNLKTVQIEVNNVPQLSVFGLDISSQKTKKYSKNFIVTLSQGVNNIKVYCTNEKNSRSSYESFEIIGDFEISQPKTYFFGIGVANYKDSSMNLTYSVKDIRDLAKAFKTIDSTAVIDTLINSKVTKTNILALKRKLMQTNIDDEVVLAITGHGLLDKNYNFYYGTYDIDFNSPEKNGLLYDDLEDLLNNIPARKKIILIDACHSGALDQDEIKSLQTSTTIEVSDSVFAKGARGGDKIKKADPTGGKNSFQLMQNLFTDVTSGNGSFIISAAGGMEYAFESADWNNGVFTYAILNGMLHKKADIEVGGNNDGSVSILELQQYVADLVPRLTKGRQQPTSRRENISYNWTIVN